MKKPHQYSAAGFLLLGVGMAGRVLLAVPEGVTTAEISLSALLTAGALLLAKDTLYPLLAAVAALAAELVLCGAWVQEGGTLAFAAPFLRLADLWLLLGLAVGALASARRAVDDLRYTNTTRVMVWVCGALLLVHTALRAAEVLFCTESALLAKASSVSFVVFSAALLWFTALMVQAYNVQRAKK